MGMRASPTAVLEGHNTPQNTSLARQAQTAQARIALFAAPAAQTSTRASMCGGTTWANRCVGVVLRMRGFRRG